MIYRDAHSALDLVNLDCVKSKQDLYLKYENSIG